MGDHRGYGGIAEGGRAMDAEAVAALLLLLDELQRRGRIEQAPHPLALEAALVGEPIERDGAGRQLVEKLDLDAGEQNLRVDEARADIEQPARAGFRDARVSGNLEAQR